MFLPLYSPQLNPIEHLWKWLKDAVIDNYIRQHSGGSTLTLRMCCVRQRLTFQVHLYEQVTDLPSIFV